MEMKGKVVSNLITYEKILNVMWFITLILGIIIQVGIGIYYILYLQGVVSLSSEHLTLEFSMPGLAMKINSAMLKDFSTPVFVFVMFNVLSIWLILVYSISQFLKVFKASTTSTPFVSENVKRIKRIAYSLFIYCIATLVFEVIMQLFFTPHISVAGLSGIDVYIKTELPFWPVMCGIIILGLAEVFNHGVELQQDNESIV